MTGSYDLIVSADPSIEPVQKDCDTLVALVDDRSVRIDRSHRTA